MCALSFDNFYYWRSAIHQKWTNLNMTHAWLSYWKEEGIWMNNKAKQIINYYIFISHNFLALMSTELLIILLSSRFSNNFYYIDSNAKLDFCQIITVLKYSVFALITSIWRNLSGIVYKFIVGIITCSNIVLVLIHEKLTLHRSYYKSI